MAMSASKLYEPVDLAGASVLITGASSGIGEAIAWRFAELGCRLALLGRRADRLDKLRNDISSEYKGRGFPSPVVVTVDVQDISAVSALPTRLAELGMPEIDILVNNAGLALGVNAADENVVADLQIMLNTNVLAPMALVSTFGPSMRSRGKGHIVNISSVAGHEAYAGGSAYCATKFALNAYTIAARHDLAGTPVRVTAISPGMVATEFSQVRFNGEGESGREKARKVYEGIVPLDARDVADQVIYSTTRPRHVQVADIISYATNQAHAKYVVERKGETLGAPQAKS